MFGVGVEVNGYTGRMETIVRSRNAVVASFPHPDDGVASIIGLAQPAGRDFYLKPTGDPNGNGRSVNSAVATFTQAHVLCESGRGDRILANPGEYAEAEIDVSKADVRIIGNGPLGSVVIKPGTGVNGMKITADDVTLSNINIEGSSTAEYALSIGTLADEIARFRAFGCKFEQGEGTDEAVRIIGCSDVLLQGNQFCWSGIGIMFRGGLVSYPTQIKIINNDFHNCIVQWLAQYETEDAVDNGKVVNLLLRGNSFDNLEAGTAPTGVGIELDHTGTTGLMARNDLAMAEHASAEIALAAGVLYVGNTTEEGINTARPD